MLTVLRVLGSFVIVALLLWLFVRASNGRLGALITGSPGGRLDDALSVLERRQLTKSAAIALIRAGERHLLVGVTDQGVQLLAEGDDLGAVPDQRSIPADGAPSSSAVVVPRDVVSDRVLTASDDGALPLDQPGAWTRSGRQPRMSFVAALREMTVRRS